MGASGKWVKALIGLKKPEKEDHVSSPLLLFNTYILCLCKKSKTLSLSLDEGGW